MLRQAAAISRGEEKPAPRGDPGQLAPGALEGLSGAELRGGLEAALLGPHADRALTWLQRCGLLAAVLPELEATVNVGQEEGRDHKDIWLHIRQVVVQAPAEALLRWGALLHDIGKVPTRRVEAGRVTFHAHAEVGAEMFGAIAERLAFPASLAAAVKLLIAQHQRANQYESSWSDSAVRRLARQAGPQLPALLALSRADCTSAFASKRRAVVERIDELQARIAALAALDAKKRPLPKGLGTLLMERLQRRAGPWLGESLRRLEADVDRGVLSADQPPHYYLEAVLADRERYLPA